MIENHEGDGAAAVEAALRAWGEANFPEDFESALRSFSELMQAIETISDRGKDTLI